LERFYQDVIDKGGEGVILRDPNVTFRPGRCPGYLKHKVTPLPPLREPTLIEIKKFRDAEAKIIRPVGSAQWECELYVFHLLLSACLIIIIIIIISLDPMEFDL